MDIMVPISRLYVVVSECSVLRDTVEQTILKIGNCYNLRQIKKYLSLGLHLHIKSSPEGVLESSGVNLLRL